MKTPIYKLVEITGTSGKSIEDAVERALKRARKKVRNMRWFQIVETRGCIRKGAVDLWQVTVRIGFALDD
jgi:hypothetical protein